MKPDFCQAYSGNFEFEFSDARHFATTSQRVDCQIGDASFSSESAASQKKESEENLDKVEEVKKQVAALFRRTKQRPRLMYCKTHPEFIE